MNLKYIKTLKVSLFHKFSDFFDSIIFFIDLDILNNFYNWNFCSKCFLTRQEIEVIFGKCPDFGKCRVLGSVGILLCGLGWVNLVVAELTCPSKLFPPFRLFKETLWDTSGYDTNMYILDQGKNVYHLNWSKYFKIPDQRDHQVLHLNINFGYRLDHFLNFYIRSKSKTSKKTQHHITLSVQMSDLLILSILSYWRGHLSYNTFRGGMIWS